MGDEVVLLQEVLNLEDDDKTLFQFPVPESRQSIFRLFRLSLDYTELNVGCSRSRPSYVLGGAEFFGDLFELPCEVLSGDSCRGSFVMDRNVVRVKRPSSWQPNVWMRRRRPL